MDVLWSDFCGLSGIVIFGEEHPLLIVDVILVYLGYCGVTFGWYEQFGEFGGEIGCVEEWDIDVVEVGKDQELKCVDCGQFDCGLGVNSVDDLIMIHCLYG